MEGCYQLLRINLINQFKITLKFQLIFIKVRNHFLVRAIKRTEKRVEQTDPNQKIHRKQIRMKICSQNLTLIRPEIVPKNSLFA